MSSEWLWRRLEDSVGRMLDDFPGVAGACVIDLNGPHRLAIRADEEFATASSIKIHVLTQLLMRAERRELDLSKRLRVTPDLHVPGSGVITHMESEVELTILDLAVLMIIVSDNTATNICIDLAGMDATNDMIAKLGFKATQLRRKMQDNDAVERGDENVSTPAELAAMMELLHKGKPSAWVAERCLYVLKKPKNGPLNRALPEGVPLANKPGGLDRLRCDAGIVYLPRRPYAISIMTKYSMVDALTQERHIIEAAQAIHEAMVTLDATTEFGRGRLA